MMGDQVARADTPIVPGPDGALSQWLLLGPLSLPTSGEPRFDPSELTPAVAPHLRGHALPWRLLQKMTRRVDLTRKAWHLPRAEAYLGLFLVSTQDTKIHVLLSSTGSREVWLDGRRISTGRSIHLRPDQNLVDLSLAPGRHRLVVRLVRAARSRRWEALIRFLDDRYGPLGQSVTIEAPTPAGPSGLVLRLDRRITPRGLVHRLVAHAPGGAIGIHKLQVHIKPMLGPTKNLVFHIPSQRLVQGWNLPLDKGQPAGGLAWIRVGSRRWSLAAHRKLCMDLLLARRLVTLAPSTLPRPAIDSVLFQIQDITKHVQSGRITTSIRRRLHWTLKWAKVLAGGHNPFRHLHGRIVEAIRSPADGSLQPYSLWVPRGYDPRRRYRLYVMLHGMNGSHRQGLSQMLGVWMPEKDPTPWSRFLEHPRPPRITPNAFILAPQAFGNSFYRHAGEQAVLQAIRQILRTYPIDPRRVILVGHSMGGTGVLELAVRHPDLFAGTVSMAGYPSRWIYPSIRKGPLRSWELLAARTWSPRLWAENARHIPLVAVHGTRDHAERATRLVAAYRRLHIPASIHLYDMGHDVWRRYLDKGDIYRETAGWRRPGRQTHIVFRTTRLRWNHSGWVTIERRSHFDRWSRVDAKQTGPHLVVHTNNVTRLRLTPSFRPSTRRVHIDVDGQPLTFPNPNGPILLNQANGRWKRSDNRKAPSNLAKIPGLEGPIDDFYYGPVTVVYGTKDATMTPLLQSIAADMAHFRSSDVRYPVVADRGLTPDRMASSNLLLIGGAAFNRVTGRLNRFLPIQITASAIRVGSCVYRGSRLGTLFVFPNPLVPGRYIMILEGTSPRALLAHGLLPRYLPDYVVFDDRIRTDERPRILGPHRSVVAAGFFDERWRPPRTCHMSSPTGAPRPTPSIPSVPWHLETERRAH
ncbi:MAG: hypothetical protein J7M25_03525 [Deltaproteobacteria bacterium]|nr:hypothetical protein [Deltaproteobacteria bacterium]